MDEQFASSGRRAFMLRMALMAGSTLMGGGAVLGKRLYRTATATTVNQVIAALLADIPGAPFPNTVDTIKAGSGDQIVTGIVTTMFATNEVIEKTIRLGANFIIAHEPTFYNHADETEWLDDDPVLKAKQATLKEHGIAVWRFHDGIHQHNPDGIRMGVMQALGWEKWYNPGDPSLIVVPAMSLREMIILLKEKLGVDAVKFIGSREQVCSKIVLMPGASGGQRQIGAIRKYRPDLLIVGELNEWETSEYVRDAQYLKRSGGSTVGSALIVLGHSVSEEPGMAWLVPVLKEKVPGVQVTHLISGDPFTSG